MPDIPALTEFLTGDPDWQPVVDDVFGKDFDRALAEMRMFDPHGLMPEEPGAKGIESRIEPGLEYIGIHDGLGLFDAATGELVGGYLGCDLVLKNDYRGRGLGAEIVCEYFFRNRDLPTWHMDEPAFTNAGIAAHKSAHRWLMRNRDYAIERLKGVDVPFRQTKMGV